MDGVPTCSRHVFQVVTRQAAESPNSDYWPLAGFLDDSRKSLAHPELFPPASQAP